MFSYVRIACISPDLFDFTGLFSVGLVSREWGRVVCWVSMADPAEGGASLVVWGHKYITFGHLGYFRGPGGDAGCLIFIHSSQDVGFPAPAGSSSGGYAPGSDVLEPAFDGERASCRGGIRFERRAGGRSATL